MITIELDLKFTHTCVANKSLKQKEIDLGPPPHIVFDGTMKSI